MSVIQIRKGKNIRLKGAAEKKIVESPLPSRVAIQPPDFRGVDFRVLAKVDEPVKVGTPLLEDKSNHDLVIVSPASGTVVAVNRGEKRALQQIVIETDGKQDAGSLGHYTKDELGKLSREDIIKRLLEGGVWPCIRQRPFSKIANPKGHAKSIFVQGMNTEPLALDIDVVLEDRQEEFQAGLDILTKLSDGDVHLCCAHNAKSAALTSSKNVKIHQFSGPHPAGNVSTHIHHVDPILKGDTVWYLRAEDVLRVADLFLNGTFSPERFAAITGEGAKNHVYAKTVIGAPISHLVEGDSPFGMRCITGSVLNGRNVGPHGFLGFYDSQITIIPEGGTRELLGWIAPGLNKYSFTHTFLSALKREEDVSLDTDKNGSDRAIVLNNIYDKYIPLDIMTYFLIRAVIAGDYDEAEKLGILECDEEDFALCTFACPSKTDVGQIIRDGLDLIEKEG